jgi:ketosteroid isomerase-like protein
MSKENVELVAAIYAALGEGRVPFELLDPEIDLDLSDRVFNPATYHGHEGVQRFWSEVQEIWEEWMTEPEQYVDAGDKVVAFVRSRGRGRGSGVEVEEKSANVWAVCDGRAVSYRLYRDRNEALRATGAQT